MQSGYFIITAGSAQPDAVYLTADLASASGRVCAACGGVYVTVAVLWQVDGITPGRRDIAGSLISGHGGCRGPEPAAKPALNRLAEFKLRHQPLQFSRTAL